MTVKEKLQQNTRWTDIPETPDGYRLSCSNPTCSLSCANLRDGRLSTTSMHGSERHSYLLSKYDMAFASLMFLSELSAIELENFSHMFNKISRDSVMQIT